MSFSPRALAFHRLGCELLIRHGLRDWSFAFNRRKQEMGLCLYGPQVIYLSVHFIELNEDEAVRDTLLHEIAQTGQAQGGPVPWAHRFRDREQEEARSRQYRQVHLEHQDCGVGRVLGEQPGDERAKAEAAHIRGRGDQRCPAAGRGRDQLGKRGRRRSGH